MTIRRVQLREATLEEEDGVLVSAPILPAEATSAPFTACWCVVKPGMTTRRHMHVESEAFVIIGGHGTVMGDDAAVEVKSGEVVIFQPFSSHALHNPETSTEDLVFVTMYWLDGAGPEAAGTGPEAAPGKKRVLVLATPPTPNGDLHLGHLSGPYLAADIYTRYLRATGIDARLVTGTDDHQTYVEYKARQVRQSVSDTASWFAARIHQALVAAEVRVDRFVPAAASVPHRERTAALFEHLYRTRKIRSQLMPSLHCKSCQRHLFEVYVRGTCPHCGSRTGGNGCEECGRPNECVDLVDPVCSLCAQPPELRSLERVVFPLEPYRKRLREFVDGASMSTHLRTLCERMLADPLPSVSVSHVSDWGIPVPVPGFEGQVIWSWLELGELYLGAAQDVGQEHGWEIPGHGFLQAQDLEVIQFFGFDNGYFKVLLLTALYLAIDEHGRPPSTFVTNEFYRLDDRKFSTSSNHVVSVLDFMQSVSPDLARFYLCHSRPELEQTNFTFRDFQATVDRELIEGWQLWLRALGRRVHERFGGVAPDIGLWTPEHRKFDARLRDSCARIERCLSPEHFSLGRLTRLLGEMVEDARSFGIAEAHWSAVPTGRHMERTSTALQLAAARALAITSSVVTPRFAAKLWDGLGCTPSLETHGWRPLVSYLPPGSAIDLERDFFT